MELPLAPEMRFEDLWVIGTGDFTDVACESHAHQFAYENKLSWNFNESATLEDKSGKYVYREAFPHSLESDTPHVCEGCLHADTVTYLNCGLTKDGIAYLLDPENHFQDEVKTFYLGDWKAYLTD